MVTFQSLPQEAQDFCRGVNWFCVYKLHHIILSNRERQGPDWEPRSWEGFFRANSTSGAGIQLGGVRRGSDVHTQALAGRAA